MSARHYVFLAVVQSITIHSYTLMQLCSFFSNVNYSVTEL